MHVRAFAPAFIKRFIWNRKPQDETNPELCPADFRKFLVTRLKPNDSLLDFGCGPGNLLAALRADGWKGHYIGVDVSTRAIAVARKMGDDNAEWFAGLIEDFAVRDVTAISFIESLYYAKNVPKLISRWKHTDIYARIVHTDRHKDVVAQLHGFLQDGPIWCRPRTPPVPGQAQGSAALGP